VPQLPRPGPEAVQRALAEVYARPEMTPPRPAPWRVWLAERWAGFWEWVRGWLPSVQLDSEQLRLLGYLVVGVLMVFAVVVLLRLAGVTARWWGGRDLGAVAAGAQPVGEDGNDAAYWEARAARAAEAGEWRAAAHALYQALLLRLDEHGALRYDAAKTPGDYRREVRRDPRLGGAFDAFLRGFEPVAFGNRALDGTGYGRLRSLAEGMATRG
jgi:hypothetical protein